MVPQVAPMEQPHELLVMFASRGVGEDVPLEFRVPVLPAFRAEAEDGHEVVEIGRFHGVTDLVHTLEMAGHAEPEPEFVAPNLVVLAERERAQRPDQVRVRLRLARATRAGVSTSGSSIPSCSASASVACRLVSLFHCMLFMRSVSSSGSRTAGPKTSSFSNVPAK